jgi:hypothetical protein
MIVKRGRTVKTEEKLSLNGLSLSPHYTARKVINILEWTRR